MFYFLTSFYAASPDLMAGYMIADLTSLKQQDSGYCNTGIIHFVAH